MAKQFISQSKPLGIIFIKNYETNEIELSIDSNFPTKDDFLQVKKIIDEMCSLTEDELQELKDENIELSNIYEQELQEKNRSKKIQAKDDKGYIYFIKNSGYIKIGKTENIKNRINSYFRTENPNEYIIISILSTNQKTELENFFHTYFTHSKVKGEWYDITNLENLKTIIIEYKDVLNYQIITI